MSKCRFAPNNEVGSLAIAACLRLIRPHCNPGGCLIDFMLSMSAGLLRELVRRIYKNRDVIFGLFPINREQTFSYFHIEEKESEEK